MRCDERGRVETNGSVMYVHVGYREHDVFAVVSVVPPVVVCQPATRVRNDREATSGTSSTSSDTSSGTSGTNGTSSHADYRSTGLG